LERAIRRAAAASSSIARSPLPPAGRRSGSPFAAVLDAVYSSPYPRTLDALAIDYYDPVASHHMALPGHATTGGRSSAPATELWDDKVNPAGLTRYLRANMELSGSTVSTDSEPLELWIVENGLCNRVRNGRSYERSDSWDRPRYMRENLAAVMDAIDDGLPVTAYYHWSLTDNYEWGSYEPRFGIHGVDRERNLKFLETDSMGRDASGTYRRLIAGLREDDRSVLRDA
jgi:6-phospho-beta-galactosidase